MPSPLRAFRGAVVCLSEGSSDDSMLHLACHFTAASIEQAEQQAGIDSNEALRAVNSWLLENVATHTGDLLKSFAMLSAMLTCLVRS